MIWGGKAVPKDFFVFLFTFSFFPMYLIFPSPVVTFTYVHEGAPGFTDFIRHLNRYLPLFRQLSEFRMVYASRTDLHFPKATEIFHSFVKIPLESNIADYLLRYFQVRKAWEEKRYREVSEEDLIFRNQVRSRFSGDRFEGMYRSWKNGHISDSTIRHDVGTNNRKHTVGKDISVEEAEALKHRKLYKAALESARLAHFAEIGSDYRLNRDAVVGQIFKLAERLASDREDYKAADTLLKMAKNRGWVGEPEHTPSLVDRLTQNDLDALKAQVRRAQEQGQPFSLADLARAIVEIKTPKVN